jgi:hypothetical protein
MSSPNIVPVFRDRTDAPWHAAWTYPRQEKVLARQLKELGFHCLLPLRVEARDYAGVTAHVKVPILPGCVFLQGTGTAVASALGTGRVRRVTELPRELCARLPLDVQTELHLDGTQ